MLDFNRYIYMIWRECPFSIYSSDQNKERETLTFTSERDSNLKDKLEGYIWSRETL